MPFNRLRRWRALLLCRFANPGDDHVYTSYDETFASDSISSKDTASHSSSSDGGISSGHESWTSSQTNVYDQICYDSMQTHTDNNLTMKYDDHSPPYTPSYLSDDNATEHYYYRLPTPSATKETVPSKPPSNEPQSNSKRELHKELVYRQKTGQLLPKKPELLNVFKQRREEEKKREEERTREQTKFEQILARQRQKLDETNNVCSLSTNASAYSNEFEFVYHRIRQQQQKKRE